MGATLGREADAVEFFEALAASPYRYDFYQTMRLLECLWGDQPRWGTAPRPADEPVRLGQAPDLSFAPTAIAAFDAGGDRTRPRLTVYFGGLFGPNGPLPLHLTEYARERLRNAGDPTFCRFLDLFHHRFLALLYRAWAQAQPHVSRDRPEADPVAGFVASFIGVAPASFRHRDGLPDSAKLFHVSTLARHVRNADGLAAILGQFFDVPVRIEEFVGHWLTLQRRDRTSLGRSGAVLGAEAVLGRSVWDRQQQVPHPARPAHLAAVRELPAGARAASAARGLGEVLPVLRARLGRPPGARAAGGAAAAARAGRAVGLDGVARHAPVRT